MDRVIAKFLLIFFGIVSNVYSSECTVNFDNSSIRSCKVSSCELSNDQIIVDVPKSCRDLHIEDVDLKGKNKFSVNSDRLDKLTVNVNVLRGKKSDLEFYLNSPHGTEVRFDFGSMSNGRKIKKNINLSLSGSGLSEIYMVGNNNDDVLVSLDTKIGVNDIDRIDIENLNFQAEITASAKNLNNNNSKLFINAVNSSINQISIKRNSTHSNESEDIKNNLNWPIVELDLDQINLPEDISSQVVNLSLSDVKIADLRVKVSNSSPPGYFDVSIDRSRISNASITSSSDGVSISLDVKNSELENSISLNAKKQENLVLEGLYKKEPEARFYAASDNSSVFIRGDLPHKIKLKDISIRRLRICGDNFIDKKIIGNLVFENVDILEIKIFKELLGIIESTDAASTHKTNFFKVSAEKGAYCESTKTVDIDALHSLKKSFISQFNWSAAEVFDYLTGYGYDIKKPFLTFFIVYLIAFFSKSIAIFYKRPGGEESIPKRIVKEAVMFYKSDVPWVNRITNAMGYFFWFQMLFISIYLSQPYF